MLISNVVESDPQIRSGQPIFKGTRFPASKVLAELAEGDQTLREIADDYDLDFEQLREFLIELDIEWQDGEVQKF